MDKIKKIFLLKEEATLMDSELYIIKTFVAIFTAYIVSKHNSLIRLDTISVFFGLMLTLEPVTLTGIRNGLSQLYASIIGALASTLFIYFMGVNAASAALCVSFTIFVCLKINWREVSAVAIFTAIYMTQYIQKDSFGNPSILLTFKLRMAALGTGVLIAILMNFIFSCFFYRTMFKKRILYLLKSLKVNLEALSLSIIKNDKELINEEMMKLPATFNNIDWVYSHFKDKRKEYFLKMHKSKKEEIIKYEKVILSMRTIAHLNYDVLYYYLNNNELIKKEDLIKINSNIEKINDYILVVIENLINKQNNDIDYNLNKIENQRIDKDIFEINKLVSDIHIEVIELK